MTGLVRGDVDSPTWPGTGRLLRIAMYGMTVGEIRGKVPRVPLLDRFADDGVESLVGSPTEQLDLRDYAELAVTGGFPHPVLRLPAAERAPWLENYVNQLLTRDVAELSARRYPQLLRRYLESYALNTAGVSEHRTIYEARGFVAGYGGTAHRRQRVDAGR